MKLELANGTTYENPTAETIAEALRTLDGEDNNYAILDKSEDLYIQTCGGATVGFIMEYREGSVDLHYQSVRDDLSLEQVCEAFTKYAANDSSWRWIFEWKQLNMDHLRRQNRVALAWLLLPIFAVAAAALIAKFIKP